MPRSKTVVPGRARRKKVLKAAKGGFSGRSKLYKTALRRSSAPASSRTNIAGSRSATSAGCGSSASTPRRA